MNSVSAFQILHVMIQNGFNIKPFVINFSLTTLEKA